MVFILSFSGELLSYSYREASLSHPGVNQKWNLIFSEANNSTAPLQTFGK
jgi:hypothetical protein